MVCLISEMFLMPGSSCEKPANQKRLWEMVCLRPLWVSVGLSVARATKVGISRACRLDLYTAGFRKEPRCGMLPKEGKSGALQTQTVGRANTMVQTPLYLTDEVRYRFGPSGEVTSVPFKNTPELGTCKQAYFSVVFKVEN